MACLDEPVITERGKDFLGNTLFVSKVKSTPGDFEMKVAAVADQMRNLMKDKPKHFANGSKLCFFILEGDIDEIQTKEMVKALLETGKVTAVIDEIQTEKMDKALMEALVETGMEAVAIDKNQTEMCAESDTPAGKHRLGGDYVDAILAMPRELPRKIPYSTGNNLAQIMGVTEEFLEEKRQRYREAAARSERISNDFAMFQEKVNEEYDRLGYYEVDDEYLAGVAELQEYSKELWKDVDRSGFKFYDPEDCRRSGSVE